MDEKKTETVTIVRACRHMVGNKMEKLPVGKTLDLPVIEANHLVGLRKAVRGSQKVEAPKKEPAKK